MEENKYIIKERYEKWGPTGKDWTNWFVHRSNPINKDDALKEIEDTKDKFGYVDKKTGLNHEYKIVDYREFLEEQKKLDEESKIRSEKFKEYLNSDEYKELKKKKREAAKARKSLMKTKSNANV